MSHAESYEPDLRRVEPALRLVHERHLRQILHFLIDRGRPLPTNTELPFWLTRADLAAADVLPRETTVGTEPRLLLVTGPDDRLISDRPRPEQPRVYWRVLFRAAVMNAIDLKVASGALTAELCRDRLNRHGPAAAREIRFVLESEHLASPAAGDVDVYRTFAAVYLDLAHFTAHAAEEFFPALPHGPTVRDALKADVDGEALFAASRPAGAADPEREPAPDERWSAPPTPAAAESTVPPPGGVAALLRKADDAEQKKNVVRAAILRTQAAGAAQGLDRERAMEAALAALRQLVDRLGDLLEWDADTREEWRQSLGPLLPLAARGVWPRAARCLYELQRIPADYARDVYAVDLPEYLRTFGRRPLRRHLPRARPVMMLMAFRKAHQQLLRAGLAEPEQLRLDRLMHHEIHRQEHAIRHAFAPVIVGEITAAGLVPADRVEEVGRDKLVAELLDRVCERGYLRIGDLRDAVARNQLKLPDLTGASEFVGGDPLLRADTRLAYALDGVYRRGEFYLRWIQRFVAVFFGTTWGRALTLYLALPFGGAFLTLMFAEELRHMGAKVGKLVSRSFGPTPPARSAAPPVAVPKPPGPVPVAPAAPAPAPEVIAGDWQFDEETLEFYIDDPEPPPPPPNAFDRIKEEQSARVALAEELFTSSAARQKPEKEHHGSVLIRWPTILGFGAFLLLVFHVPPFRRAVFLALGYVWRAVRGLLWDVPAGLWRSRAVRAIRLSGTARFLHRHFATPLMLSLIALGIAFIGGAPLHLLVWWGWTVFVFLLAFYNMPFGWVIQDRIAEVLSDWWRQVRVNLLPGLVGAIIDWFRMLANWVERQLYAVDEWMRFRGGDSQGSLALKAVLGLVWFPIAYVTRFVFYLLVEPQVNPVKHFPVVTVSHKVIWPMVPTLAEWTGWTVGQVSMVVNGIPGIFGFIAWELKENWRLYAANRSPKLKPATVGSHGESIRGLLRPGFHSGTVPKIHRKSRRALEAGDRTKLAYLHHELEHVAEGVHRFAERELVPLLAGCPEWGGVEVEVHGVRFGVRRAEVAFAAPALGHDAFVLALENVDEQIDASVARVGWADKLTYAQRAVFVFALRGLLDLAAAARFDGRARTFDAPEEPGFGALTRRVTWEEWVKWWDSSKC
ncbi:MAG: hypothetical protein J0I06_08660 [Planctomycetes bacterium]|nr:hypothetical protein [Planctomycetota bacterium]